MKNKLFQYSYPYLIVITPILFLYTNNVHFVDYQDIFRTTFWILLITSIAIFIGGKLIKNTHKAGLIISLGMLLLEIYGHIYLSLEKYPEFQRHRFLIFIGLIILIVAIFIVTKLINDFEEVGKTFTVVFSVWIISMLFQIGVYQFNVIKSNLALEKINIQESSSQNNGKTSQNSPDIYWIVLDGYTGSDVLERDYNYDDSPMIEGLENLGFYVAKCSQSNYPSTVYSLTSALNADYLQNFLDSFSVLPSWASSTMIRTLRENNYQIISFKNSVKGHFDLGEDLLIEREGKAVAGIGLFGNLNEFELLFFETSILRAFKDGQGLFGGNFTRNSAYNEHYFQTKFNIESAEDLSYIESPKFVLLHIIAPHDPYIFAPDGSFSNKYIGDQINGYASNVEYLGNVIPATIENILANSPTPPIIIVQGDHGPTGTKSSENRMSILNAYYFPDDEPYKDLYSDISPVNTYRIVLNHYFNGTFSLLEDRAYHQYSKVFSESSFVKNNCDTASP